MKLRPFYITISLSSIIFGVFLLASSVAPPIGAVIGAEKLTATSSVLWAGFFLITGIALYLTQRKNRQV